MKWVCPHYDEIFHIDEAFDYGKSMCLEIQEKIEGGIGCSPDDAGILAQCVRNAGSGDYLEFGTLFGGSAIIAGLVKKKYGLGGRVVCIDDLEMFYRTKQMILSNAAIFDVVSYLEIHVSKTNPYPLDKLRKFSCIFIDAGHDYHNCKEDWLSARGVADRYIIFHDYDLAHKGVMNTVLEANFPVVFLAHHTAVLEKL